MAFLMYVVDSRPMLYSPAEAPRMELCERFPTLADATENALTYWPEDGMAPVLIYREDGLLAATLAPAGPFAVVVIDNAPGAMPVLWTNVLYVRDGDGRIVATELTDKRGTVRKLTHPV